MLEKEFESFVGSLVSEWNPVYADDGMGCRYTWDDEIGAHDVEVELDEGGGAAVPMTSEERAIRDVPARWAGATAFACSSGRCVRFHVGTPC